MLVNNDGGGIFSFLPQAQPGVPAGSGLPEHYEELFGTPHGVDVAPIVTALGGEHRCVTHGDLEAAIRESIGRPGVRVLELRTDRARNVELHREAGGRRPARAGHARRRPVSAMTVTPSIRWAVRDEGAGHPVLLLHGFTGTSDAWDEHGADLVARHRILVP